MVFQLLQVIENLEGLENLKCLYLGKNKITKIQNLDSLKMLETLSLQVGGTAVVLEQTCRFVRQDYVCLAEVPISCTYSSEIWISLFIMGSQDTCHCNSYAMGQIIKELGSVPSWDNRFFSFS
jgi:hypothetical protein